MRPAWSAYWPLPLRLVLGFGYVYHGWGALGSGHAGFARFLQGLGVPAPDAMAWVVALVEVLGGLALLAGAFVALAAIPLVVTMLVAVVTVHLPHGFDFFNVTGVGPGGLEFGTPGYEVPLLYVAGLVALMLGGAGPLSVDAARRGRRNAASGT